MVEQKSEEKKETEEEILNKNLSNPIFVNYNIIKNLEEIRKVNYSILELLNILHQNEISEQKEGVFRTR